MSFPVDSQFFKGPVDLLLYLVRRHEVEVTTIELAKITNEFLAHLEVLKELSVDSVGDFIEVASLLVEMKARALLPRNEFEKEEDDNLTDFDPRADLVHRLLLYKRFKDVATMLDEHATTWQNRYGRMADDLPMKKHDISDQPIHEIELWDLVSAFGRVLRDNRPIIDANIVYDETPIQVYMQMIHQRIVETRRVSFSDLFVPEMHKSAMVGVFLAVLELARHHNVVTVQDSLYGELVVIPAEGFQEVLDVSDIDDDYNPHGKKLKRGDPGSMVE